MCDRAMKIRNSLPACVPGLQKTSMCFCSTIVSNMLKFLKIPKKAGSPYLTLTQEILTKVILIVKYEAKQHHEQYQVTQIHLCGDCCQVPPSLASRTGTENS